jgi:parallel beta-helix repeat protein
MKKSMPIKIKTTNTHYFLAAMLLASLGALNQTVHAQGSLTPSGAPAPMMKTLDQVEPRTAITNLPFTITEPGSYYLVGNLASSGDGVVIQTNDVTLDLMGFTLTGSGANNGIHLAGTTAEPRRNIVVRNGIVRQFTTGVNLNYANACRIEDMVLSDFSWYGVYFNALDGGQCDGNVVVNCTITRSGNYGVRLQTSNEGSCSDNLVSNCSITDNNSVGVVIMGGDGGHYTGNRFEYCIISGNGSRGMRLIAGTDGSCEGNTVMYSTISRNADNGIFLDGQAGSCAGNSITYCTIDKNGSDGLYLRGSTEDPGECSGNRVVNNSFRANTVSGIYLHNAKNNYLENNLITGSTGATSYGIQVSTGTTNNFVLKNTAIGQNINFNIMAGNTWGPIVTDTGALTPTGDASHPWANFSR